jgi:hypothetical protein
MEKVEVHVAVGMTAIMIFLVMAYAHVQSNDAIFGLGHESATRRILPYATIAFVGAALFVILFFYNMHDQERVGKIVGLIASGVAKIYWIPLFR